MTTGKTNNNNPALLSPETFRSRYTILILLAWTIPAIFGLSFLLYIKMFSIEQMRTIMTTPLEPLFVVAWILISLLYFRRYSIPIQEFVSGNNARQDTAIQRMARFPLHFWSLFLIYLVMAPSSVILSAEIYANYQPQPVDWFRIHLVALIVSIIVGLPIFFIILDLFGRAISSVRLQKAHVTIRTKVFLIGALVPLLVDTMLVQYYWTRTGYFSSETFFVWLTLEALAVAGSLIFVRSFIQSLGPLQSVITAETPVYTRDYPNLRPQSTDELGVLTSGYNELLKELQAHNEVLSINNRLLRGTVERTNVGDVLLSIIDACHHALTCDTVFLMIEDEATNELVGVIQTGSTYREDGHFRLTMHEESVAVNVFKQKRTIAIYDANLDPRVSTRMRDMFNVHSALASPIMNKGKITGVIMCITQHGYHEYTPQEIILLEGLARESSMTLNTWQLYQEKIQAQKTGLEKEDQLRLLMNSTEEAIYGVDTQGICTFVNPACVRMLGYDDESELVGTNLHDLIHHTLPDGTPYPKEICRVRLATLAGTSGHADDEVHWRKDGTSFPVEYWSHPIFRDGNIVGTVVSFIDITSRKRTEKSLRAKQASLTIINKIANRLYHSHDVITVAREAVEAIQNYSQSPSVAFYLLSDDKQTLNLVHAVGFDELSRKHGAHLTVQGTFNGLVITRKEILSSSNLRKESQIDITQRDNLLRQGYKAAVIIPLLFREEALGTLTLIFRESHELNLDERETLDAIGKTIGLALANARHVEALEREILQRKQAQKALIEHKDNLELMVQKRTEDLSRLNSELEAFSYSVSHDLRTPLRSLDGFSQALLEDYSENLDDTGKDYLERIRYAAQRMSQLIDDILQLSRVSRIEAKHETVDLSSIAEKIVMQLHKHDPERIVDTRIQPGIECMGDSRLLMIALENLLSNAWKYTSKTEHAEIRFQADTVAGRTVYSIEDNGAGFDMKHSGKLFGPFQRLHHAHEFEGTGVGLVTVQRIIHRHGGEIWADAEVDKGAKFYFTIGDTRG